MTLKWKVTEGSHWRESKQMLFLMSSVLRAVCSSACSCFPDLIKNRVLENRQTKEENIMLSPLKLNVPWQFPVFYFFIIGDDCRYCCEKGPEQVSLFSFNNFSWKASICYSYNHQDNYQHYSSSYNHQDNYQHYSSRSNTMCNALKPSLRV